MDSQQENRMGQELTAVSPMAASMRDSHQTKGHTSRHVAA